MASIASTSGYSGSSSGKARTKSALQNYFHDGGHAFAEPPSKLENKSGRRASIKDMANKAGNMMKKARKSMIQISKKVSKKLNAKKTFEQSDLCSLVRDIEVAGDEDQMVLHGIARVFFMDAKSYIDITFDRNTLVGEFNHVIADHLKIVGLDGVCSVVEYCYGNYLPVKEDKHVIEVMGAWEEKSELNGDCRLCYVQEYYFPGGSFDTSSLNAGKGVGPEGNLAAHKLRYLECCHRLRTGMYSLSVKRSIEVAAMQIVARRFEQPAYYPPLNDLMSPSIIERFGLRETESDVKSEVEGLEGVFTDAISCEQHILEVVSNAVSYYGSSFFPVKSMLQDIEQKGARSKPVEKICAVSNDGIHLLSGWNLTLDEYYPYSSIHRWTKAENPSMFAFVDDDNIHFMIYEYPEAIDARLNDSIEGLMEFHQGNDTHKSHRSYEELMRVKSKFLAADEISFPECAKVQLESANLKSLIGNNSYDVTSAESELVDIDFSTKPNRRSSLAMTQLVSAGAEIDEDVSRNLEEAEFNGFDKNSNVDEETRKKERRMSAIRALNAKRQAKR